METRKYKKYNFNSEYKAKGYPESIWPALNEYFSRDAAELELSDKEVRGKLDTLLRNLDTIEIDNRPDSTNNAFYCPSVKKITLNIAGMNARNGSATSNMCVLWHELGHVDEDLLSQTPNSLMYFDRQNRLSGVCLSEIHKEMRAARLTMNVVDPTNCAPGTDPKLSMKYVGYNDLMFIGTMFHTALGISEKEFLVAVEKGPEYFRETMSKKFPDPKMYDEFYKSFTRASDTIHALKYNTHRELTEEDYRNIANQTANIYGECLNAMEARLAMELQSGEVSPEEFAQKSKFELERLAINYVHGIKKNTPYSLEELSELPEVEITQEKVLALEAAIANRKQLGKKEYNALVSELSEQDIDVDSTLDKYGLMLPSISDATEESVEEYKKEFLEEDYGSNQWDNSELTSIMQNIEHDSNIRHSGIRVITKSPMAKLKELNTDEEVTSYDARLAASNAAVEVNTPTRTEDSVR